jgi:hypothetical protein
VPYYPKSAGVGLPFGLAISRDAKRLAAAAIYWRDALKAEGETALATGAFSSEAIKFANILPDALLTTLIPEFAGHFESADEDKMVSKSGCLMSTANLTQMVYGSVISKLEDELKFLGDLATTASAPDKKRQERAARALQLAREVYDLIRRFGICAENAKATDVSRSELMAIYIQEGALGIAPPRSSWLHAPLIHTVDKGCRTHRFNLWDGEDGGGTTARYAWVVSHKINDGMTPSKRNPISESFGTAIRHLVIVAGADTIIDPRLLVPDELLQWYAKVRASPPGTFKQLDDIKTTVLRHLNDNPTTPVSLPERQRSLDSQKCIFDGMAIGLLMLQIEMGTASAPFADEKGLVQAMAQEMAALIAAHPVETDSSGRIFLAPADDHQDAKTTLFIQARWFASRRRIETVLAVRDRAGWSGQATFAPILSYLRYNIGEFSFLRLLCRFAAKMKDYRTPAFQKRLGLVPVVVTELAKVAWTPVDVNTSERLYATVRALSAKTNLASSPGWRHVGYLDALSTRGPVCCKPIAAPPLMKSAADTARDALKLYQDKGLFDLLALFMTTHPVKTLVDREVNLVGLIPADSLQPTRNAFSFERLRRAYANALNDAKINEIPH